MFALALYDRRERSLLLARDHAGIKPLYYLLSDAGIFCASQYDQIMRHPWAANRPVSPDGLALYLRLGYIPAPYALLAQTHMLPAGAWLRATADGLIERGNGTHLTASRTCAAPKRERSSGCRPRFSDVPLGRSPAARLAVGRGQHARRRPAGARLHHRHGQRTPVRRRRRRK
jgi:asparagine synthetase B (glutamine-hydrolysing)